MQSTDCCRESFETQLGIFLIYRFLVSSILITVLLALGCGGKESGTSGVIFAGGQSQGGSNTGGTRSYAARDAKPGGNYLDVNSFPQSDIVSGGVGKDQIPSLNQPRFVDPESSEAFYIRPDDLVLGVVINVEAKAYPQNIGWHHEIINDDVGWASNYSESLSPHWNWYGV